MICPSARIAGSFFVIKGKEEYVTVCRTVSLNVIGGHGLWPIAVPDRATQMPRARKKMFIECSPRHDLDWLFPHHASKCRPSRTSDRCLTCIGHRLRFITS